MSCYFELFHYACLASMDAASVGFMPLHEACLLLAAACLVTVSSFTEVTY